MCVTVVGLLVGVLIFMFRDYLWPLGGMRSRTRILGTNTFVRNNIVLHCPFLYICRGEGEALKEKNKKNKKKGLKTATKEVEETRRDGMKGRSTRKGGGRGVKELKLRRDYPDTFSVHLNGHHPCGVPLT